MADLILRSKVKRANVNGFVGVVVFPVKGNDMTTDLCPGCGDANVFPGFTEIEIYKCRQYGAAIDVRDRS